MAAIIVFILLLVALGSGGPGGDAHVKHRLGLRIEAGSEGVESSVGYGIRVEKDHLSVNVGFGHFGSSKDDASKEEDDE